ncbi:hypothetical protein CANINC_002150 [Pichia inconspicua]|uniref:SRR1-like domain-containing protein n=1 Tax=Pichia inconspicua TaxID=52247 RepID=A0A4T0X1U9_9ASCO|nr:hypothetical protein CANINC_002150 [[Candida] inconspicua]
MVPSLAREYENKLKKLENSKLINDSTRILDTATVSSIRCLGLGSITVSSQAMYQLCFISLIKNHLEKTHHNSEIRVTLWDPVFTDEETSFLKNEFNYIVDEKEPLRTEDTLYFMPHFPIVALENIITKHKPRYIFSNNLLVYTFKFTDTKYFELYPNCARIVKLIQSELKNKPKEENQTSDFQIVSRKKKISKRTQYVPKTVHYDFESAYFANVNFIEVSEGNNSDRPWSNAFTDLAFFEIISKNK